MVDATAAPQMSNMTPQDIQNYMTRKAMDDRMQMANELMYGKGQTQQPEMKHWTQLLGNLGNRYTGNKMWDQARQQGRASSLDDAGAFKDATWGGAKPPVPFMNTSTPIPGTVPPNVQSMQPNSAGQPPGPLGAPPPGPGMPTPGPQGTGLQPQPSIPFMNGSGGPSPSGIPPAQIPGASPPAGTPYFGGIFGGMKERPVGWPDAFNPQG